MKKKYKCCVCHNEINDSSDMWEFKGQLTCSIKCLHTILDKYNAITRLKKENAQLKDKINKLNELTKFYKEELSDWKCMGVVEAYEEILNGDNGE